MKRKRIKPAQPLDVVPLDHIVEDSFQTKTTPPREIIADAKGLLFGVKNKSTREYAHVTARDSDHARRATKWHPSDIAYCMQLQSTPTASSDAPKAEGKGAKGSKNVSKGTLESLKATREAKAIVVGAGGKVVKQRKTTKELEADLTKTLAAAKKPVAAKKPTVKKAAAKAEAEPVKAKRVKETVVIGEAQDKKTKVVLLVDKNPKKEGTSSARRFGLYVSGKSIAEQLYRGVTVADIRWDKARRYIDFK
jgi:hypothetical protein